MNNEQKDDSLIMAFKGLKETAEEFGAGGANITTDDGEWQYTLSVKRLKSKV